MTEHDAIESFRGRLHKVADQVQNHELRLAEQRVLIDVHGQRLDALLSTGATKDNLTAGVATVVAQVAGLEAANQLRFAHVDTKLAHLSQDLQPIRAAVYWTAGLIVAGFITALIALVWRGSLT